MSTDDAASLQVRVGGLTLANPIICAAGEHTMEAGAIRAALASGAACVIAKSVNDSAAAAAQLDRADYAMLSPHAELLAWGDANGRRDSLFCRSGLAQTAPADWFRTIGALDRAAGAAGQFVAASIVLSDEAAAMSLAAEVRANGIRILELNVGAPHAVEAAPGAISQQQDAVQLERLVSRVKQAAGCALWVKLSSNGDGAASLARAASQGGADAVVVMGRYMAFVPDVETMQPVLGSFAAYGGGWALPLTCRQLALARRANGAGLSLIGTNGARSGLDVARMILAGASAVEFASLVMRDGYTALTTVRDEFAAWLQDKKLAATEVVGLAADALRTYADQPVRPGWWRNFAPETQP